MDPATIATAAATLLVPYVKKAAEAFAGEVGKTVLPKVGALLALLKQRLAGDPVGEDVVARFERTPDTYRPMLEDVLRERLAKDEAFRTEAARQLADIRAAGPELEVVQRMNEAVRATGVEAGELSAGRVKVEQNFGRGTDVTGARIDRIGP